MAMNVTDPTGHEQNRQAGGAERPETRGAGGDFLRTFRTLPESRYRESPNGVQVAVLRQGSGKEASSGMRVKVHYTGWTQDGQQFDSSLGRGEPFGFTLGAGRVIKGWEEGLTGMQPGERRQLVIPAEMAYGERQVGDIPPGSTLVFNVEAVAVEDPNAQPGANPKGTRSIVA